MGKFVLVETRDPFESRDVSFFYEMARELADKGESVTLFLAQNAVLATRRGIPDSPLATLLASEVSVKADGFSLRERGVAEDQRLYGLEIAEIDDLVDLIMDEPKTRVLWH